MRKSNLQVHHGLQLGVDTAEGLACPLPPRLICGFPSSFDSVRTPLKPRTILIGAKKPHLGSKC